jgi:hypothetical protein
MREGKFSHENEKFSESNFPNAFSAVFSFRESFHKDGSFSLSRGNFFFGED